MRWARNRRIGSSLGRNFRHGVCARRWRKWSLGLLNYFHTDELIVIFPGTTWRRCDPTYRCGHCTSNPEPEPALASHATVPPCLVLSDPSPQMLRKITVERKVSRHGSWTGLGNVRGSQNVERRGSSRKGQANPHTRRRLHSPSKNSANRNSHTGKNPWECSRRQSG